MLKTLLKGLKVLSIFLVLTIISQIGGLVYIASIYLAKWISGKSNLSLKHSQWIGFLVLYLSISILILPIIAKKYQRYPLPWFQSEKIALKPANILTCILNRHYVKLPLKESILEASREIRKSNPDVVLLYLDANFPLFDYFPLLPHLSHNDGKKLDLNFLYKDGNSGKLLNNSPTFMGYGFCEYPLKKETDYPSICSRKGYWQYNLLKVLSTERNRKKYKFDKKLNADLLRILTRDSRIKKIFIEPHLKERLGFSNSKKVRFHGCQAVRHDDHIHIQL